MPKSRCINLDFRTVPSFGHRATPCNNGSCKHLSPMLTMRRVVRIVAVLNLGYFGVEPSPLPSARSHCSPTVSTSFEDASVNFLILVALGWTVRNRARVGMMLAGILLVPGLATLWTAWQKLNVPAPPEPLPLSLASLGRKPSY
jgi:Co/Zn/Cd efflux system component